MILNPCKIAMLFKQVFLKDINRVMLKYANSVSELLSELCLKIVIPLENSKPSTLFHSYRKHSFCHPQPKLSLAYAVLFGI